MKYFLSLFLCYLISSFVFPNVLHAEAAYRNLVVDVFEKRVKRDDKDGDFDDKRQVIALKVRIRSQEGEELKGLNCHIKIIGEIMTDELRQKRDEAFIVLDFQKIPFQLDILEELELVSKPITVNFDESNAARQGARYEGYVVSILDSEKNVIFRKADRNFLKKNLEKSAALPVMEPFNDDLEIQPKLKHKVRVQK